MEQIFAKKVCKNCKETFYTSKAGCDKEYCPHCKADYVDEGLLEKEFEHELNEKEWIDLASVLNKTDRS